jgi:hypothetical protein
MATKQMSTPWTFGGVQMTEKEYAAMEVVVWRGTCPYCLQKGLKSNFGAKKKHIRACGSKLSLLEKEKLFAEILYGPAYVAMEAAIAKAEGK